MVETVNVVGGGPAGLLAARLLALDHPSWRITVYERLPPEDTFGFGVGLTSGLLTALHEADADVFRAISSTAHPFAGAAFRLPTGEVELARFHTGAISRARLLQRLLEHAVSAGVDVRLEEASLDAVRADADVVIAADGVSSGTRTALAAELGAEEETGRGLFIWCGCAVHLSGTVFMPVTTEHGLFVAHAYPYDERTSTLVIETDEASLRRAGCQQHRFADDAASDALALDYLSAAFAELLDGRPLIGNRSRWLRFRTVRCRRWSHGSVALLGDAKATAHPSLGAGTKLALEDAIALARALRDVRATGLGAALDSFEAHRRPPVERLQERARRSQLWWESIATRMHLSPARLAASYLSRSGAVSLEALATSAPGLAARAVAEWSGTPAEDLPASDLPGWILRRPLPDGAARVRERAAAPSGTPELVIACDDPWCDDADDLVRRARSLTARGAPLIALDGGRSRAALLDRLAIGERIRQEVGVAVAIVSDAEQLSDASDGIVAGRADAVLVRG